MFLFYENCDTIHLAKTNQLPFQIFIAKFICSMYVFPEITN